MALGLVRAKGGKSHPSAFWVYAKAIGVMLSMPLPMGEVEHFIVRRKLLKRHRSSLPGAGRSIFRISSSQPQVASGGGVGRGGSSKSATPEHACGWLDESGSGVSGSGVGRRRQVSLSFIKMALTKPSVESSPSAIRQEASFNGNHPMSLAENSVSTRILAGTSNPWNPDHRHNSLFMPSTEASSVRREPETLKASRLSHWKYLCMLLQN